MTIPLPDDVIAAGFEVLRDIWPEDSGLECETWHAEAIFLAMAEALVKHDRELSKPAADEPCACCGAIMVGPLYSVVCGWWECPICLGPQIEKSRLSADSIENGTPSSANWPEKKNALVEHEKDEPPTISQLVKWYGEDRTAALIGTNIEIRGEALVEHDRIKALEGASDPAYTYTHYHIGLRNAAGLHLGSDLWGIKTDDEIRGLIMNTFGPEQGREIVDYAESEEANTL